MKHFIFLILLTTTHLAWSQDYPLDYFRHPLDIPISISGSFAEIRPNHYHSGIDYRIGGKIGAPVYAAADGYVSRIAISPWGGGKVLYIDHPNGYRSVYMHLNDFVGKIGKWVNEYQYQHHCYAFYEYIPADAIPIKKGQLIAHAGNSGSSGGPHLHFEIRESADDKTINPLYFGFAYSDPIKPNIRGIKIYPQNATPITLQNEIVTLQGRFYTGIYTTDLSEQGLGKNGIDHIELYIDGKLFFRYHNQAFLFEDTRSVNAIIDYHHYLATGEYYILTRSLPNIQAPHHQPLRDSGWIIFNDNKIHSLEYKVFDHKGNYSSRSFQVQNIGNSSPQLTTILTSHHAPYPTLHYYTDNIFDNNEVALLIPQNALYDEDSLQFSTSSNPKFLSPTYSFQLTKNPIPPHIPCTLKIRIPDGIDTSNLIIVQISTNKITALPTSYINGWLQSSIKSFGTFAITRDNTPPTIKPVNFSSGKLFNNNIIKIKIADNLSGIESYHCILNGSWILAEFDGKTSTLSIPLTTQLKKGKNSLVVQIEDAAHNQNQQQYTIIH